MSLIDSESEKLSKLRESSGDTPVSSGRPAQLAGVGRRFGGLNKAAKALEKMKAKANEHPAPNPVEQSRGTIAEQTASNPQNVQQTTSNNLSDASTQSISSSSSKDLAFDKQIASENSARQMLDNNNSVVNSNPIETTLQTREKISSSKQHALVEQDVSIANTAKNTSSNKPANIEQNEIQHDLANSFSSSEQDNSVNNFQPANIQHSDSKQEAIVDHLSSAILNSVSANSTCTVPHVVEQSPSKLNAENINPSLESTRLAKNERTQNTSASSLHDMNVAFGGNTKNSSSLVGKASDSSRHADIASSALRNTSKHSINNEKTPSTSSLTDPHKKASTAISISDHSDSQRLANIQQTTSTQPPNIHLKSSNLSQDVEHSKSNRQAERPANTEQNFSISLLGGHERKFLEFIFQECKYTASLFTREITSREVAQELGLDGKDSEKARKHISNIIKRVSDKGYVYRARSKSGKSGWMVFEINKIAYDNLLQLESINPQRLAERLANPSREKIDPSFQFEKKENLSISTPEPQWFYQLNFSQMPPGFRASLVNRSIATAAERHSSREVIQDFIDRFPEFFMTQTSSSIKNVVGFFCDELKGFLAGTNLRVLEFKTPLEIEQEAAWAAKLIRMEEQKKLIEQARRIDIEQKAIIEFENWWETASPEEKNSYFPRNPTFHKSDRDEGYKMAVRQVYIGTKISN